ncbi:hypothetical protein EYS14_09680 [Alteromonadaceae bacterium M269]|nr:hypothetical protein EYS14_09680 [Alteromonadaceae bacterium M269]
MLKENIVVQWVSKRPIQVLVPIWLIWTALAFYYFASKDLVLFDPNDDLASMSGDMAFDSEVVALFQSRSLDTTKRVYHLLDDSCRCNSISEDHRQQLNFGAFAEAGYSAETLPYQPFSNVLPSSPAVVIFNERNELVYMGPYSAGFSCDSSNSFVERVFKHSLTSDYLGATIVHEAKGCYCNANQQ